MKKRYSLDLGIDNIILQVINDFENPQIELDEHLFFTDVEHLKDDEPDYVIRFRKDCLMLPSSEILPCVTLEYESLGRVEIEETLVFTAIDLTDEDAQTCYFDNKEHLIGTFSEIHNHKFRPEDFIVIYKLGKFEEE